MTFAARALGTVLLYTGSGTAGVSGPVTGYINGTIGSLSPTTMLDGKTIERIAGNATGDVFSLTVGVDPTQSYFTSLTTGGNGSGLTQSSAAATYTYSGGVAKWQWSTGIWSAGAFTLTVQ